MLHKCKWLYCILIATMPGCDATSPLLHEEEEILTLLNPHSTSIDNDERFYCSGYSLNKPGEERKTNYFGSIQFFPEDLLEESAGNTGIFFFLFTAEDPSESDWAIGNYDNVVRTAVCHLPDVEHIEEIVAERFIEYGPFRWLPADREPGSYRYFSSRRDSE